MAGQKREAQTTRPSIFLRMSFSTSELHFLMDGRVKPGMPS
jgi:hypothetical protein